MKNGLQAKLKLLGKKKLAFIFLSGFIFNFNLIGAYAQDAVVTGIVTAADGSTIPGVNVLLKGTGTGKRRESP